MYLTDYLKLFFMGEDFEIRKYHNHQISIFTDDTRKCLPSSVFFAIKGLNFDGHQVIEQAISNGAKTIICEKIPKIQVDGINYLQVKSSKNSYHQILLYLTRKKREKIKIIGITGTNGKTTVATLTYDIFKYLNLPVLLIGTNGSLVYYPSDNNTFQEITIDTPNTTPKLSIILELINKYSKIKYLVMEVSSEALASNRIEGLKFDTVVFTNLGHDHLNSHLTFEEYLKAKLKLFKMVKKVGSAIVNMDDSHASTFLKVARKNHLVISTFGILSGDLRGEVLSINKDYMMIKLYSNNFEYVIGTNLLGNFNLLNILTTLSIIETEKLPLNRILSFFEKQIDIKGRYEKYLIKDRIIYIDYAHNPDALKEFLKMINRIKEKSKVITVIGAGGEKDKQKRPKMGHFATFYSDLVIYTEDNSRAEPLEIIINDLIRGAINQNYLVEYDRNQAIKLAFVNSKPGDIINLLGMGPDLYRNGKTDYQMAKEVDINE